MKPEDFDPKLVWKDDLGWYKERVRNKPGKWKFFREFVLNDGIKHILEIGGGDGYVSEFCGGRYVCIDVNDDIIEVGKKLYPKAEFISGDWLKMSPEPFVGQFDLVLAGAVVEHLPHYKDFVLKCLDVEPRFVMVTFFHKLHNKPRDRIVWKRRSRTPGVKYYSNYYSKPLLETWLRKNGFRYGIHETEVDILVIEDDG